MTVVMARGGAVWVLSLIHIFFGDKIIPFVDKFPTDTKLYQVMTTKPADLAA